MTSKNFAATAFAAMVLFSSCDWLFGNKENPSATLPLQAQWKLDSVQQIKDTGLTEDHLQRQLRNAARFKDSLIVFVNFNPDSVLKTIITKDTFLYKYYTDEKEQRLFVMKDSGYATYKYAASDSSLQLTAPDSTLLFLSRK